MGPMVAGISALIPDGPVLNFQYANQLTADVTIDNGRVNGGGSSVTVDNASKIKDTPIAIILNKLTASSGELTALAFSGLDNVRSFGENSAGYTSGNSAMRLYDGTMMQLTSSRIIDRQGIVYENDSLIPDFPSSTPLSDAKEWIKTK